MEPAISSPAALQQSWGYHGWLIGTIVFLLMLLTVACSPELPATSPPTNSEQAPRTKGGDAPKPTSERPTTVTKESTETDESGARSAHSEVLAASKLYDECSDRTYCQEAYGDPGNPVLVSGQVVRKTPQIVFISSPEALEKLDDLERMDPADRLAALGTPEVRYALEASSGQVACDASVSRWDSGIRFTTTEDGKVGMSKSTRVLPPEPDSTWMEHVNQGDVIVVHGVYITNLVNPYVPVIYGCGKASG